MTSFLARPVATLPGLPSRIAWRLAAAGCPTVADLVARRDDFACLRLKNLGARGTGDLLAAVLTALAEPAAGTRVTEEARAFLFLIAKHFLDSMPGLPARFRYRTVGGARRPVALELHRSDGRRFRVTVRELLPAGEP